MLFVAAYAIAVAILVVGMWVASLATDGVPELRTRPWEIRHHIAAELLMAGALAVGGALVLLGADAGRPILEAAFGMTVYSVVNSSGYYVQRRQAPLVAMFAGILALTIVAAVALAVA